MKTAAGSKQSGLGLNGLELICSLRVLPPEPVPRHP